MGSNTQDRYMYDVASDFVFDRSIGYANLLEAADA